MDEELSDKILETYVAKEMNVYLYLPILPLRGICDGGLGRIGEMERDTTI
jgi:hypothetical protein